MNVELAPLLTPLLEILVAVALAMGTFFIKALTDKLGLEADGQLAGFLEDHLRDGIRVAEKRLGKSINDADVTIQNQVAAEAADWVIENAPKAVKRLVPGGQEALKEKAKAFALDLVDDYVEAGA